MEPETCTYDLYLDDRGGPTRHYMNTIVDGGIIGTHIKAFGYLYSKDMGMLCVVKPYSTEYLLTNILIGTYRDMSLNNLGDTQ